MTFKLLAKVIFKLIRKMLLLFLLLTLLLSNANAAESKFSIIKVYPEDLYPSEITTVQITLKNIGNCSAYHVTAELLVEELENTPLKFIGNAKKSIGRPNVYTVDVGEEVVIQYEFYVEKDAEPTVYYIPLKVMWSDKFWKEELEKSELLYFGVRVVKPKRAEVDILNITTYPAKLKPGEKGLIEVKLKNIGNETIQSLNMRLLVNYPITPLESDLEEFITQIEPGEIVVVNFSIAVDDSATDFTFYEIPLILEYEDKFGSYRKNTTIGVEIRGEPKILIQEIIVEPSELTLGSEGMFMITLINIGTESANDVKIKISGGEELLTGEYQFIGEIAPGDSQTTTFGVNVDSKAKIGEYGLTINISYKDRYGNSYSDSKIYVLQVYPTRSLIPMEYVYVFIVIAVLFIVGYVIVGGIKIGKKKET